ncbi:hypothetical protein A8B75_18025 [Sphingomonadales bacterium EhC05]|nr:hypothetical protein A8B75_18025 [Sphingomonadales bacterium EhC05]
MKNFEQNIDNSEFKALTQATFKMNNLLLVERDRISEDLDMTSARWQILETAERQLEPSSASQIARLLQISRQAVQRVLNDLVKLDFVLLEVDEQDRRVQNVSVTQKGSEIIKELESRTAALRQKFDENYRPLLAELSGLSAPEVRVTKERSQPSLLKSMPDNSGERVTVWQTKSSSIEAESPVRRSETVKDQILAQILKGKLQVGDRLPPERELASLLNVGRSAIREALRSLEMAGILKFRRGAGGGAFIKETGSDGIETSLRSMLILGKLPLMDVLDLRASLLAQCARLGAQRGTEEDFERLDQVVDELDNVVSSSRDHVMGIGPATEFYRLAARSTHNPLMVLLVDAIANLVAEMLVTLRHRPRRDSVVARREMVAAMRDGNTDAAARVIRLHAQDTNILLMRYKKTITY